MFNEFFTLVNNTVGLDPDEPFENEEVLADEQSSQLLETQVINGLVDGTLPSPQVLSNSLYYKFRFTGTGDVWRDTTGDTYRRPEHYLNDEVMARAIGVPVVVEHPEKGKLETTTKLVGTTVHSYVPSDLPEDIWVIARITDGEAQAALLSNELSTSPSVVTAKSSPTEEGAPLFIDHLAIVPHGVWDHDNGPNGIVQDVLIPDIADVAETLVAPESEPVKLEPIDVLNAIDSIEIKPDSVLSYSKETDMTPEELKAMLAGAIGEAMKPFNDRLNAMEVRADSTIGKPSAGMDKTSEVKDDAASEEEGVICADGGDEDKETKQNAEIAALKKELASLKGSKKETKADAAEETKDPVVADAADEEEEETKADAAEKEEEAMADARTMADSVTMALGQKAIRPFEGEKSLAYRKRVLAKLQQHSAKWATANVKSINDSVLLANIETDVFADSLQAAKSTLTSPKQLRASKRTDEAGRTITSFYGDMDSWMGAHKQFVFEKQPIDALKEASKLH